MPRTEKYSPFEAMLPLLSLRDIWVDSFKGMNVDATSVSKIYNSLESGYQRPFFNLTLLSYLLDNYQSIRHHLQCPNSFVWATFFMFFNHQTHKRDTFIQSGLQSGRYLHSLGIPETTIEHVQNMIFSITNLQPVSNNKDIQYFVDNYLSVYAQETLTHIQLLDLLKQENHLFDDNWFMRSRLYQFSVLLKRKEIFNTIEFYNQYEWQIRKNFLWELNRIR